MPAFSIDDTEFDWLNLYLRLSTRLLLELLFDDCPLEFLEYRGATLILLSYLGYDMILCIASLLAYRPILARSRDMSFAP